MDEKPPVGVLHPQRLLRIATVIHEVLVEVRHTAPKPETADHLRRLHERIFKELRESLPDELYMELEELTPEVLNGSVEELALAHAEILGWLEGLFQGTQLALQLEAARAFQEQLKARERQPQESHDTSYL